MASYAVSLKKVFHGVEKHGEEIDGMIEKALYRLDQKPFIPCRGFCARTAVYEMLYEEKIRVSVSINEEVESAKTYGSFTEGHSLCVNGVLGSVAKEVESIQ